jgi:ribosomal protein L37AE/L43A
MPDLATMQTAIPKCPRVGWVNRGKSNRCGLPMLYNVDGNVWKCVVCGTTMKGLMVAEWGVALDEAA